MAAQIDLSGVDREAFPTAYVTAVGVVASFAGQKERLRHIVVHCPQ